MTDKQTTTTMTEDRRARTRRENMIAAYEEATGEEVTQQERLDFVTQPTTDAPAGVDHAHLFTRDADDADSAEWVPYLGPDGGEGWQQINPDVDNSDRAVVYDDEPPGDPLYEGAEMVNLLNYPDIAEEAIDEALENGDLSDAQRGELTEAVAEQLIDSYGVTMRDGELTIDHSIDSANMERGYRQLIQEAVDTGMVEERTEAERAAEQLGWEDPVTDVVEEGDSVMVADDSAFEFLRNVGRATPPYEVEVGFIGDDYIEGFIELPNGREQPVEISDLTEIEGMEFESRPDNTEDLTSWGFDVIQAAEAVFGSDSEIYQAVNYLAFPDTEDVLDTAIQTALENGYERDEIEAFLENVNARDFTYPDAQEFEQFDADMSDVVVDALAEADDVPDGIIPDVTERAVSRADGDEPTGTDYLIAAKTMLGLDADIYAERSFVETVREQMAPDTLDAAEVDEIATEERLTRAFHYAEQTGSARDLLGIDGGNTTGDEMDAFVYADGSFDLGVPVDAYENITTGVVTSPAEAKRNNRDSPKVIDQFGGTACETEIAINPDGEEYIMKEGLSGQTLRDDNSAQFRPGDREYESAVETLAAAYFVGNRDLHTENLFITDEREVAIIDHDSAGPSRFGGPVELSSIINFSVLGNFAQSFQGDVEQRVEEIIEEIDSGELDIPDDVSLDHEQYIQTAINEMRGQNTKSVSETDVVSVTGVTTTTSANETDR